MIRFSLTLLKCLPPKTHKVNILNLAHRRSRNACQKGRLLVVWTDLQLLFFFRDDDLVVINISGDGQGMLTLGVTALVRMAGGVPVVVGMTAAG